MRRIDETDFNEPDGKPQACDTNAKEREERARDEVRRKQNEMNEENNRIISNSDAASGGVRNSCNIKLSSIHG